MTEHGGLVCHVKKLEECPSIGSDMGRFSL